MSEILTYGRLGFHHIADLTAADHVLFLLALAAGYRPAHWRPAIRVITAFTLGHSLTLGLAVTGLVTLPIGLIEFLIPVTIVVTCLENLRGLGRPGDGGAISFRAPLALIFGLVHGAGFASYLREMFVDRVAIPLLGFNLGIEAGQLLILLVAGTGFMALDRAFRTLRTDRLQPFRARVIAVSAIVLVIAGRMTWERSAW